MNTKNFIIAVGIVLSFITPVQVLAKYSDDAYKKRVALAKKRQYVTGVNYQHHEFSGLLTGNDSISAQQTALNAPNQFFGATGQPPTLRVVPKSAKADVILPFINYTISNKVSLVALAPLIKKQSTLETFQGGNPNISLGTNTVKSSGLGDIKFGALYKVHISNNHKNNIVIDAILSAPTGSIKETDTNLTPANTMIDTRLGYGLQLGSGTWDALVGLAYWGKNGKWSYGGQYLATLPLEGKNSEGWRYGDKHELTAWTSYQWKPTLASSLRLRYEKQGKIKGSDSKIFGPGLGAQTENYGGNITEISIGLNWMYASAKNISIEYVVPISQDRNGYQAKKDSAVMISWRLGVF